MSRILVTGFEPFCDWTVNSSWEAVWRLGQRRFDVRVACLPVDHRAAAEQTLALIARHRPHTVLLTGLAGSATAPRLEIQARLGPGLRAVDPVRAGRWPFRASQRAVASIGAPCRLSADAGRYVCETTYWAALGSRAARVAFLHLPPVSQHWPAHRLSRVVDACLAAAR